jgi:putative hydrolase of the HAD superfamily
VTLTAVIFDWGGTLTPFHDVDLLDLWRLAAPILAREHVAALTRALVRAEQQWWGEAARTGRSGTTTEVLAAVSASVGLDVAGAVRVAAADRNLELWTPHTVTDPEAASVLRGLFERGLATGLVSNTRWPRAWHERWLARDGVLDLIDARIYTSDLPFVKPHPHAFRAVLTALGVADPATALFVGDRPVDDIWGAQQAGMRTALVRNTVAPSCAVRPDAEVGRLGHLLPLVDRWMGMD